MKIKRDNYESYFLDYLEGNLEGALVDEFIDFLQNNPDLKDELKNAGFIEHQVEEVTFPWKEKLYKHKFDIADEFNKAAVARLEGDLTAEEIEEFDAWLDVHPAMRQELKLFEISRLQADSEIIYAKKDDLYRKNGLKRVILWSIRIAAVLLLAFLVYRIVGDIPGRQILSENQLVVTENKIEKPENVIQPNTEIKVEKPSPAKEETTEPAKAPAKSTIPYKGPHENDNAGIYNEQVTKVRTPAVTPERLPSRNSRLLDREVMYTELKPVKTAVLPEKQEEMAVRLPEDAVREKMGLNNLSVTKVAKAGLNLVANLSGEKFTFVTNKEGQITELNYNSRLLAFSIPTNHNK